LKRKRFLRAPEEVDIKNFKVGELGTKGILEKPLQLKGFDCTLTFTLREPIRQKEFDEIPIKKLVLDSFPEPFRGENVPQ